jgi:hypothetical protein
MKETTKAIIGAIGLTSVLAIAVFTRSCGPKLTKTEEIAAPVKSSKTKVKTGKKVTTLPNGTTIRETTTEKITVVESKKKNRAGISATCDHVSLSGCREIIYGVGYERRIFDNVFIGAGVNSRGGISISTSVEF